MWPAALKRLVFGSSFDEPLVGGVVWPLPLEQLFLRRDFNPPLAGVMWLSPLKQFVFGYCFDQPIAGVMWPPSLEQLTLVGNVDQPFVTLGSRRLWSG